MEIRRFRLVGTRDQLQSFLKRVKNINGIQIISTTEAEAPQDDFDSPFGNQDFVSILIDLGVGLGAGAAWDLLKYEIDALKKRNRRARIDEIKDDDSEAEPEVDPPSSED